jgi:N-acetylglucosaminyldiphosphoundecaprenol N-acetyl-beta-D-mannosaminyltransferase
MKMNGQQIVPKSDFRQILGVRFFVGGAGQAIDLLHGGGLLVVPAAPALKNLPEDRAYREALIGADLVIADSSLMVMVWNFMQRDNIRRLSGLEYLAELLTRPEVKKSGGSFWIMANPRSSEKNLAWLGQQGIEVPPEDIYVAPIYGAVISDEVLLDRIRERRPEHIIVTIGGGTQEKLGLYLKRNLETLPAIHCVGAAIAFLSGDQVQIPMWADRFYFGWIFRCISQPKRFVPRYWSARKLVGLLVRYKTGTPLADAKEA